MVSHTTAKGTEDQEQPDQTNIKFPNNRLLIDLCGEFDKNLAEIEQKLTLQIVRRGNELNLFGDEISRSAGKIVLEVLYTRLENGKSLDSGDLDRELRDFTGGQNVEHGTQTDKQIEMVEKSNFEIKTRKKTIEPRTNAQRAFASSLLKNELVFGIGPAGTGKTYLAIAKAAEALEKESYLLNQTGQMSLEQRKDISSRATALAQDMERHGMKLTSDFCV